MSIAVPVRCRSRMRYSSSVRQLFVVFQSFVPSRTAIVASWPRGVLNIRDSIAYAPSITLANTPSVIRFWLIQIHTVFGRHTPATAEQQPLARLAFRGEPLLGVSVGTLSAASAPVGDGVDLHPDRDVPVAGGRVVERRDGRGPA